MLPGTAIIQSMTKPVFKTDPFLERRRAVDFVFKYIPHFCVYCEATGQIYSDYSLHETSDCKRVIVMPKMDHGTFNEVCENSVSPTRLMLIPNPRLHKARILDRSNPDRSYPANAFLKTMVFKNGFVPLVKKSDLRRMKTDLPFLTMHHVNFKKLQSFSPMSQRLLLDAIKDKVDTALYSFGAG